MHLDTVALEHREGDLLSAWLAFFCAFAFDPRPLRSGASANFFGILEGLEKQRKDGEGDERRIGLPDRRSCQQRGEEEEGGNGSFAS